MLFRSLVKSFAPLWVQDVLLKPVFRLGGMIEPWEGTQVTLYALLSPEVEAHPGAFFSQLDKAAANLSRRILYNSPTCETAVTHKFSGTYHKPCYVGDLIFIEAHLKSLGHKSIVMDVFAYREKKDGRELVADANFVFVSIKNADDIASKPALLPYAQHQLEMP